MAKKKISKKIVTKSSPTIPTTLSDYNSPAPSVNVVQTPSSNIPTSSNIGWPIPSMWYQQGAEVAKKAYFEYHNAMNQYLPDNQNQPDYKLEMAGKMNAVIVSMVQGVAIALEAAEDAQRRVRTGDQAAVIELEAITKPVDKLLKTIWVHNKASYSGKHPGLDVALLDANLVGRINRCMKLGTTDFGTPVTSVDEAATIWMDEQPSFDALQSMTPPEMAEGEPAVDENGNPIEEEVPLDEEGNPIEEAPEEVPVDENGNPIEETPEDVPLDENGNPIEEEVPVDEEGSPIEEVPLDEEGNPIEEEVPLDEEIPVDENGNPIEGEPVEGEGEISEEEIPTEEEEVPEEGVSEGEEEVTDEESSEEEPEEGETDEEESVYCIVCDREVTQEDIDACDNPECPFRFTEEEDTGEETPEEDTKEEDQVSIDDEPVDDTEEGPPEEEEPDEEEEKKKHFVMIDQDDHSECNIQRFTLKDFDGAEGEYCLDCHKPISYSFDQDLWTSSDAKAWVKKQFKANKIKNKSAEEIVKESIDRIPDNVLKQWLEKELPQEPKEEELDLNPDEFESVLKKTIEAAFNPIVERLSALEA